MIKKIKQKDSLKEHHRDDKKLTSGEEDNQSSPEIPSQRLRSKQTTP